MRKILVIIIAFIPVLLSWGQGMDEVKAKRAYLNKTSEVINDAIVAQKINESERLIKMDSLNNMLKLIDDVIDGAEKLPEENSNLREEALNEVNDCIKEYGDAIYQDSNWNKIQIRSIKFLTCARTHIPILIDINDRIKTALASAQEPQKAEYEQKVIGNQTTTDPQIEEEGDEGYDEPSVTEKKSSSLLVWIALLIGLLGVIVAVLALIKVYNTHDELSILRSDIKALESKLSQKIKEIKPTNYRGGGTVSQSSKVLNNNLYDIQAEKKEARVISTPRREKPVEKPVTSTASNTVVQPATTLLHLYATINVRSPYAEFAKVTSENPGNKIFMLTLTNPDAEVAEFTIVPNMSSDFLKSVINDRDTYLPSIFCEKTIDSPNPTHIDVVEKGHAKKEGDKWLVHDRIVLKLV